MSYLATHEGRQAELQRISSEDGPAWNGIKTMLDGMQEYVEEADRTGELPAGILESAPANILNRMNLPTQYGGLQATSTAQRRAIIFEMVGHTCAAIPMAMPGPGLAMPPIFALGTEEQKTKAFSKFANSDTPRFGAFAITEPQSGSDAVAMRTTAKKDGDNYIINGEKCFISNGARADDIVVFASIAPDKGRFGIRAFLIGKDTPGFNVDRTEDMMGLRVSQLASLSFTDCIVPKTAMLGHNGKRGPFIDAFTGAQSAWDYMRPALASGINGACFGILNYAESLLTQPYGGISQSRRDSVFERIQLIRQTVLSARLIAFKAAEQYDLGKKSSFDSSMAKAYSSKISMEIGNMLAKDFPEHCITKGDRIEKFYRDAKAFDILEGTGDMQRRMISKAYTPTSTTLH